MEIAIIVVSSVLAAGLIALFVTLSVLWKRSYPKTLPNGEPRPKQSAKQWFLNHLPSKRRLIQVYAALLYNANIKGFVSGQIYDSKTTKYLCVPGFNCYSCPGAIGACPLGALQNALAETNTRAPYYVVGILALFGLIFARTVCGFLCPVGLGQDLLYKIRTPKLKKSRVTRVLSYLKYVFLAVLVIAIPLIYANWDMQLPGFCKYVCPAGTLGGAIMLMIHPDNAGMYANLGPLFTWKFCVLTALVVLSVFIYRFFCRFICPLGAIYGFFNRIALLGIKVDKENCTDCGLCVSHCKMDVKRVGDHECINCGECIPVCPTKAIRWKGSKLLVHGNSISASEGDARPLGQAFASVNAAAVGETPLQTPPNAAVTPESVLSEPIPVEQEAAEGKAVIKAKRKGRGAKFWLELSAWLAALALLVGALVYYNAIDVKRPAPTPPPSIDGQETGFEVGALAPDFTVAWYGREGAFNLYENRGTVTIVNFWATWCGGCKSELPYFNELSEKRTEWSVVAIHGDTMGAGSAEDYIAKVCSGWALPFAQDVIKNGECQTFASFGGRSMWPLTVISDEEGKIAYNSTYEFKSFAELETVILNALGEGTSAD